MSPRSTKNIFLLAGIALCAGCEIQEEISNDAEGSKDADRQESKASLEVSEELRGHVPTIVVDGKRLAVSRQDYIEHHLKLAESKYALIAIPDG